MIILIAAVLIFAPLPEVGSSYQDSFNSCNNAPADHPWCR